MTAPKAYNEPDVFWESVPVRIQDLYVKYAYDVSQMVKADPSAAEWRLLTPEVGEVTIKRAEEFFPAVGKAMHNVQIPVGGPNPLTAMLLGGALGAGVGGLGGHLAHKFMPEWVGKDAAKKWALLGGLGGAAVPGGIHAAPNVMEYGPEGMLIPSELQGGPAYKEPQAASRFSGTVDALVEATGLTFTPYPMQKTAIVNIDTGQWRDVILGDPYLSSPEKAVVAGLPYAAGAARGSRWVSPMDVARVAANAGLGAAFGKAIGAIAGPFLGLTPTARKGIQRAGLLAGAIKMLTRM